MMYKPPTTSNTTSSDLGTNTKRYPRSLWLRVLRWIFLQWWLIPFTCLIIYILILAFNLYTRTDIYHVLLLLSFMGYWWVVLLFRAYTWANTDKRLEYDALQEQRQRELEQRQRELEQQPPPPGFKLQHTLREHTREIRQIAWSPDGRQLASGSNDQTVRLWDGTTGQALHTLTAHTKEVFSGAFAKCVAL
jgi:WD40 repeat protein